MLTVIYNLINANFRTSYTTYIRPHLEHCIQAVGPHMVQDFSALEKVQGRATKLVQDLKNLTYKERLKILELPSVEERVRRGDLIETFKILSGHINTSPMPFFAVNNDCQTRGHSRKLKVKRSKTVSRAKFFSNHIVHDWNKQPEDVIMANNTNTFKNRLDQFMAQTTIS